MGSDEASRWELNFHFKLLYTIKIILPDQLQISRNSGEEGGGNPNLPHFTPKKRQNWDEAN